ncbi:MAG TPA: response regulator transcription factor [Luteolibacter sp.]|nr:response regulator transcription factor [Luteolibacter sp.]
MNDILPSNTSSLIWLIEDHDRLRGTLKEIIGTSIDCEVVAFADCETALAGLEKGGRPEVIVLDLGLPGMSGLEGIRRFKDATPSSEIIVFTVFDDRTNVFQAICAGASGYLLKSEPLERVLSAIHEVRQGGAPMTPEIARLVLDRFSKFPAPAVAVELSDREKDVLRLLAEGLTKKELADRLDLSVHTVDNYLRRVYRKLHVNTLGGAVAKALRDGLL